MNIEELKNKLKEKQKHAMGAYQKAIYQYAFELVDNIADDYITTPEELEHSLVKKYQYNDTIRGRHLLDYQASALARAFSKIDFIIKMSKAEAL